MTTSSIATDYEVPSWEQGLVHIRCERCKKWPYSVEIKNLNEKPNESSKAAQFYCQCRCGGEWVEVWQRTKSTELELEADSKEE